MMVAIKLLNNNKFFEYYEKQILYSVCEKPLVKSHEGHHCRNSAK